MAYKIRHKDKKKTDLILKNDERMPDVTAGRTEVSENGQESSFNYIDNQ